MQNKNKESVEKLLQACQLFLDKKNYQSFVDTTFELEKEKLSASQKMELHSLKGKLSLLLPFLPLWNQLLESLTEN